jgi:hypothetical protein
MPMMYVLVFVLGVVAGAWLIQPSPYANEPSRYTVSKDGT